MQESKSKAVPIAATFILVYGIVAIVTARVPWIDGISEAVGNHARAIGAFSIAFSLWIFFCYFRQRTRSHNASNQSLQPTAGRSDE
jgi:hypothetical protein